jgi:spoIIIJ-associated protein
MQPIIDYTQDLLAHMGIADAQVNVSDTDDSIVVHVSVSDQESGMLIGHHGETISALQRMLNISFRDKVEDKRVIVNINDYKEQREEVLKNMARRYADRALESGADQVLPFLPANERLIIHMELKNNDQVETHSEGEGPSRRLIVSPKM